MLKRLSISNYLLIDHLELDLSKGFTIITGETGSGKSILIGALGLAMGDRADAGLARDAEQRCIIELEVEASGLGLENWCEAAGVPYEMPLLIRRQLDPNGRSRAFVNDTPVRLEQLRELGERLIHVHSQHHTLLLNDPRFQLGSVDHAVGNGKQVAAYRTEYKAWRATAEQLREVREEEARARSEFDFISFQLEELEQAKLKVGEQEELETEVKRAEHAGEIQQALQATDQGIAGDDGAVPVLTLIRQQLGRAAKHDGTANELLGRLTSVIIELQDMAGEAARSASTVSLDPREAARLQERLDLILRLQQKHRTKDTGALIAVREDLRSRSTRMGSLSDRINDLERSEAALRDRVHMEAERISAARRKAMPALAKEVVNQLKRLGMPHARFVFDHHVTEAGTNGIDTVRALFSANKDREPEPLDKVASGGELGRVMLALIALSADGLGLPTIVFDEIDTGVSGEVADRVGELMGEMARKHQVIAITHLPQIASKADVHLLVSKDHDAKVVTTDIRPLLAEERVQALAQMLSGRKTTATAVQHARELLAGKA